MSTKKPRKDRSDSTVSQLEKKHGMPAGTIRNADGRDTRADKKIGTIRKAASKKDGNHSSANELTQRAWEKTYANRTTRKVG